MVDICKDDVKVPVAEIGSRGMKHSSMSVGEAYAYAMERAEKIRPKYPAIAIIWAKEAELLRARLGSED